MKRILIWLCLILMIAPGCRSSQQIAESQVTVLKDGKSSFQIVLPDQYDNAGTEAHLQTAAKCLQKEFQAASGVLLPIRKESSMEPDRPAIFIGNTAMTRKAGYDPASFQDFSYVIAVKNGNIFLAGNDRHGLHSKKKEGYSRYILGSVKAIVVFMEDYLHTRFVMPGDIGISTPEQKTLELPSNLERRGNPLLNFAAGRGQSLMYDYSNNNYGRGSYAVYGGHSYYTAVPAGKYGKSHPEYFALLGGKRVSSGNHLCISNPEVQDLIYAEMLKRLDAGAETVELAQTDGYKPCECERCKAYGNTDSPGEKIWILHRALAERLLKERPGKKVLIICYPPNAEPPESFREFPDNVMIELCHYSEEEFQKWSRIKVPQGFTVYIYNWGYYSLPGITPKHTPEFAEKQVRRFAANGVRGIYRCGFGELMGLEGPVYYVYGKLLDNPQQSAAQLTDDYFHAAFGEASAPMRTFFNTLHSRLALYSRQRQSIENVSLLPKNPRIYLAYVYSPDVLETMERNLTRAEKLAVSPKVKKRLELVRREFDYVKNLGTIIHYYNAYRLNPNRPNFDQLAEKIDERNAMIRSFYNVRGQMNPIPGWQEIRFMGQISKSELMENGRLTAPIGAPLTWNIALLREKGVLPGKDRKKMEIGKAAAPVSQSFDFNSGAWKQAKWHELNGIQLGAIQEKSRFKAVYDTEAVYFGIETDLPENVKITPCGQDGPCWGQDCLELILDPFGSREKYYHFIFNPVPESRYESATGFITDVLHPEYGKPDVGWNGQWEYFTQRTGNRWYALVKIPFAALGVKTPAPGTHWTLNVGRESFRTRQPELSSWSPNLETMSFHDRDSFGEAVFE